MLRNCLTKFTSRSRVLPLSHARVAHLQPLVRSFASYTRGMTSNQYDQFKDMLNTKFNPALQPEFHQHKAMIPTATYLQLIKYSPNRKDIDELHFNIAINTFRCLILYAPDLVKPFFLSITSSNPIADSDKKDVLESFIKFYGAHTFTHALNDSNIRVQFSQLLPQLSSKSALEALTLASRLTINALHSIPDMRLVESNFNRTIEWNSVEFQDLLQSGPVLTSIDDFKLGGEMTTLPAAGSRRAVKITKISPSRVSKQTVLLLPFEPTAERLHVAMVNDGNITIVNYYDGKEASVPDVKARLSEILDMSKASELLGFLHNNEFFVCHGAANGKLRPKLDQIFGGYDDKNGVVHGPVYVQVRDAGTKRSDVSDGVELIDSVRARCESVHPGWYYGAEVSPSEVRYFDLSDEIYSVPVKIGKKSAFQFNLKRYALLMRSRESGGDMIRFTELLNRGDYEVGDTVSLRYGGPSAKQMDFLVDIVPLDSHVDSNLGDVDDYEVNFFRLGIDRATAAGKSRFNLK